MKNNFNINALATRASSVVATHIPCCGLAFAASAIGIPIAIHPAAELAIAVTGAIVGDRVAHKFLNTSCCEAEAKNASLFKKYKGPVAIGILSWGLHQAYFHDHSAHEGESHDTHNHTSHDHSHHHSFQDYLDCRQPEKNIYCLERK